jgi:hypothetical protein
MQDDPWHDFDVLVARRVLDEPVDTALIAESIRLLTDGVETPSLAVLAAVDRFSWSEVDDQLRRVLRERDRPVPRGHVAVRIVANDVLERIALGQVAPEDGLRRVARLADRALDEPSWADVRDFFHMEYDWEVAKARRLDLDPLREQIRDRAGAILARGGVRQARSL